MRVLESADLVRQYDPPQDEYQENAWKLVADYRRVQEYAAKHPDAGRVAVGNALDLPPSRVRGWLEGGMPDAVRGLTRAQELGWVPLVGEDDVFRDGLNQLVAWVYSGGSINENFVPSFAIQDRADRDRLDRLAAGPGITLSVVREGDADRATEVRPTDDGALLGRVLVALGAPRGPKNERAEIRLPEYLDRVDERVRMDFARTYLRNRLSQTKGRSVRSFREQRSIEYLDALSAFLDAVLDVDVYRSERNVYLSEEPAIVGVSSSARG